jgi:hypothetical protein
MIHSYEIFVGKHEGKRPTGRPRRRWENNIKMDLIETGLRSVDMMHQTQGKGRCCALVDTTKNRKLP